MARRMKWGSVEDLQYKIDEYFENDKVPTVIGLCVHLDISRECFSYYCNKRYKYKHKSAEEKAEILRKMEEEEEDITANEAKVDYITITDTMEVIDNIDSIKRYDDREEDSINRQLSDVFKKARARIEDWTVKQALTAKNPAGAIFVSKACFDYRETAPEQANTQQLPTKIVIEVLPQPSSPQPQIKEHSTTTYSVLPEKSINE